MSYLKNSDPNLFSRFLAVRHLDQRVSEAFDDLEMSAQLLNTSPETETDVIAEIVAELTTELRTRVAKCEVAQGQSKE